MALSHAERKNQFCFSVNRYKYPLVSDFRRVTLTDSAGFLLHESPNLIKLQIPGVQITHHGVHYLFASVARENQQSHDGIAIQASEPFRAANGTAFKKTLNRTHRHVRPRQHRGASQFGVRFTESGFTGIAAPPLDAALTEMTEPLAGVVLASDAGHGFSPLDCYGEKPENLIGARTSGSPLRFGLAPADVCAAAGAFVCYSVKRWGPRHRFLPAFLKRPALESRGVSYLTPKSEFSVESTGSAFPAVACPNFKVASLLQFSSLPHPPHGRVDGRHMIVVVPTEIKPHFLKHRAHHLGCKDCAGAVHRGTAYYGAYGIGEAQSLAARLLCDKRCKGGDCLKQLRLTLCKPSLLGFYLRQLHSGFLQSDYEDSQAFLRTAVSLAEKLQPRDYRLTRTIGQLGRMYQNQQKFPEAAGEFRQQLAVTEEIYGAQSPENATPLMLLGTNALLQHDYISADRYYSRGLELNEKTFGPTSWRVDSSTS